MYQAIYKCRLCGEEFSNKENIANQKCASYLWDNLCRTSTTQHFCKDDSIGLADFQGLKKAEV